MLKDYFNHVTFIIILLNIEIDNTYQTLFRFSEIKYILR